MLSASLSTKLKLAAMAVLAFIALSYGIWEDMQQLAGEQAPVARAARKAIPARYLTAYRDAAAKHGCRGLSWEVLAAIGSVESDHGRSRLRGVRSGWNSAGAAGPMQFGIGRGRAGNSWGRYGHGSVYRIENAAPAAARYLCANGYSTGPEGAVYAYNHSQTYVAEVFKRARRYRRLAYPNRR